MVHDDDRVLVHAHAFFGGTDEYFRHQRLLRREPA
jgi:hypothetical protein